MTTILQDVDQQTGNNFSDAEKRLALETAYRKANSKLGRTIVLSAGAIPYVATDAVAEDDNEGIALAEFVTLILQNGLVSNRMREQGNTVVEIKTLEQLFNESGLYEYLNTPDTMASNLPMKISNVNQNKRHWRDEDS